MIKYLYRIDNNIYTVKDDTLTLVSSGPVTEEMFLVHGNDEADTVALAHNPKIDVLAYTQNSAHTGFNFVYTSIWKPQICTQNTDFDCTTVKSLTITARNTNVNDTIRVLLSHDSGATWGTCSATGIFTAVDIANVKTQGMTVADVNGLSQTALRKFTETSQKLRLLFYLEQTTSVDKVYIDHVQLAYA